MGEDAKCPYCKVALEDVNCFDDYCDAEISVNKYEGECPLCKRHFTWEELYVYEGIFNMEETNNG